jgi:hypothetical protein
MCQRLSEDEERRDDADVIPGYEVIDKMTHNNASGGVNVSGKNLRGRRILMYPFIPRLRSLRTGALSRPLFPRFSPQFLPVLRPARHLHARNTHLRPDKQMKHENIRWNPSTGQWFCPSCGRTSSTESEPGARAELDQHECTVPFVEASRSEPGTETRSLIRKPYKMTLRTERSGSRFVVPKGDDGTPTIRLELFHDTISPLKGFTVEFEVLSGTTAEQVKSLVDAMNERIVGVIVSAQENTTR